MNELISKRKPLYSITFGDIEAADLPTGIDAVNIADGSITNTEFKYLDGLTSAIQTQLTARLPLAGGTMTGSIVLHADPSSAMHAATKQYVDSLGSNGVKWKEPVRVATTTAQTLGSDFENGDTIDGIVLATNDRILVKNQASATENGIYTVNASGTPTRATDADAYTELNGATVFVLEGTANADKGFMQVTELTSFASQSWVQNFGTGLFVADETTLTLSGSTFAVKALGVANAQVATSAAIDLSKLAAVTASRALVSTAGGVVSASSVTATELGYVSGVSSAIQTQINAKQATITGGATTIALSDLTASRAVVSNGSGKIAASSVTSSELNLLSGLTGTVVTTTNTQTLTNKTLTSPKIGTAILDTSGNELIIFSLSASAVNEVTITNAATTGTPTIAASGSDANISLSLAGKGTGAVLCGSNLAIGANAIVDGSLNEYLKFSSTASAVNEITVTNAAAGGSVKLDATGGSSNIDLHVGAKGTGVVYVSSGDLWTSGYFKHKSTYSDKNTATDGATVTFNLSLSNTQYVLIQGNRTLALSNPVVGQWFYVMIQQDGTGSRTVTWWTTINWPSATAPTLSTGANKVDVFAFYCFSSGVYMGFVVGQNIAN